MRKVDPVKHEATRQRILEAAVMCFARRGFHQTSTAEICVEAGMSPGNLFHYFASKQALIEALVEEDRREISEWFARTKDTDDLFATLLDLLDLCVEQVSNPIVTRIGVEIMAEALRNPKIDALVKRNEAERHAALLDLLRKAAARGQVDASLDLPKAATWVSALIDGAFGRAAMEPSFAPAEQTPMLRLLVTRFLRPGDKR